MSKQDISISASTRDIFGKKVKQLRTEGVVPAVIHERGKDSLHVAVNSAELRKVFLAAGKHHAVQIDVAGKKYTTIIKEIVNEPASVKIYHAVFQAIKADEKVTAEIPLRLVGEIPAERANLLVLKNLEHLDVEALPSDLVDVVEADASNLAEVGDKLHVSDLKVSDKVTIKNDPETVIASVEMPKDQIAEADAALEEMAEQDETDVESEQGTEEGEGGESEGEIRPGGKKEKEDHDQGTDPQKQ